MLINSKSEKVGPFATLSLLLPLCLLWALAAAPGKAWGKPVIIINALEGNAFAVSEGKTWPLKNGEYLEDFCEVLTEEGTEVTFTDLFGHSFRLTGSGHIKMINKILELKRGYLWVKSSPGQQEGFTVHTANAKVEGRDSDAVISFDNATAKTQLLVTRGLASFSNIIRQESPLTLTAGSFSFISKDFEEGVPRNPTPIGFASFKSIMSLFGEKVREDFSLVSAEGKSKKNGLKESMGPEHKDKESRGGQGRSIASMEEEPGKEKSKASFEEKKGEEGPVAEDPKEMKRGNKEVTPGKIIFIKAVDHKAAQVLERKRTKKDQFNLGHFLNENLQEEKKEKEKQRREKVMTQHSQVKIKIYGANLHTPAPSSRPPTEPVVVSVNPTPTPSPAPKTQASGDALDEKKEKLVTDLEQKMQQMDTNLRGAGRAPASVTEKSENGHFGQEFEKALKKEEMKQLRHPGEVNQLIKDLESFDKDYEEKY